MYWILLFTVLIWYAPYCVSNSANDMNIVQMSTLVFLPVIAIWMIRSLTCISLSQRMKNVGVLLLQGVLFGVMGYHFAFDIARWE